MTIKKKLYSILLGEVLLFCIAAGVVVLLFLPINGIKQEADQLRVLREDVISLRAEINKSAYYPLDNQYEKIAEARKNMDGSFERVAGQRMLAGLNNKVAESMEAVLKLDQLFQERWTEYDALYAQLLDDAERTLYSRSVPVTRFYTSEFVKRFDDYWAILHRAGNFLNKIDICDGTLASSSEVITEQFDFIEKEVNNKTMSIVIKAMCILAAIILGVLAAAFLFAHGLAVNILRIEGGVEKLGKGDLTVEFGISTKDELGILGENMDQFTSELSSSIRTIKEISAENLQMKESLIGATESTSASVLQISRNASGVGRDMEDLSVKVSESAGEVVLVRKQSEKLSGMLQEQLSMIEESTSAVTEMIASIGNVYEIAEKKKDATSGLVATAEEGGAKLKETLDIIRDITSNVDEIRVLLQLSSR